MAGRKRGESLEERLAAIRTAAPEPAPAPAEVPEPVAAVAPAEEPEASVEPPAASPEADAPAAPEAPEPALSFQSSQDFEPPPAPAPNLLSSAAEGDTFLPGSAAAANRVDVGIAVQAAVRQLWPELEKAEQPVQLETSPEETPLLSKLLGRGRTSGRRGPRDAEPETAAAQADVAPSNGEVNELNEIIAEISEITEVAAPPRWVPVRGRIPKPRPPEQPEPDPVADELEEIEEIVAEIVEEPVAEVVPEVVPEVVRESVEEHEPLLADIAAEIAAEMGQASEPEPAPEPEPMPAPEPVFVVAPEPVLVPEPEPVLAAEPEPEPSPEPELIVPEPHPFEPRIRTERFGRIGTTLIERGLVTNEQLDEALEVQRISGRRVGDILVDLGALSSFELARVLADHMGVPFTDLRTKPPDPVIAALLPEEVARRYDALAISRWNDQLVVAMANPTDLFALDDLQMVTRQPIIAAMAVKEDLRAAIDRVYRVSIIDTVDAAKVDYSLDADADAAAARLAEDVD
jgi:hypothetical protein